MNISRPDSFKEFVRYNEDFLEGDTLLYYFLKKTITDILEGKTKFYVAFTILKEDIGRIVVLVAKDVCLIYENGFDPEMFEAFCEQLEFEKFRRYNFAGNKGLIDALFQKYSALLEIDKHRIVYKCSRISENFTYSPGNLKMGNSQHIHLLTEMGIAFSKAY